MMHWFLKLSAQKEEDFTEELSLTLSSAQKSLWSQSESGSNRMGTTATLAYILWPRIYVIHAGDIRCYVLRDGQLEQITIAQRMVDDRIMTQEQAATSSFSHVLWNCVDWGRSCGTPQGCAIPITAWGSGAAVQQWSARNNQRRSNCDGVERVTRRGRFRESVGDQGERCGRTRQYYSNCWTLRVGLAARDRWHSFVPTLTNSTKAFDGLGANSAILVPTRLTRSSYCVPAAKSVIKRLSSATLIGLTMWAAKPASLVRRTSCG